MIARKSRYAAALAAAATLGLAASPVLARDHGGWGGGWGGGWDHHDHDIDAGDVFAGLLVLGGIIAVASAASHASNPPPRRADPGSNSGNYGNDSRPQWHGSAGGSFGIDAAVGRCTEELGSGSTAIDRIDTVNRSDDGWRIAGRTSGGANFECAIASNGQVRSVSVNGHAR